MYLLTCTGWHCAYPQAVPQALRGGLPYQNNWVLLGPGQQECTDTVAMVASPQAHELPSSYTYLASALYPLQASMCAQNHHGLSLSQWTPTAWSEDPPHKSEPTQILLARGSRSRIIPQSFVKFVQVSSLILVCISILFLFPSDITYYWTS